MEGFFHLKKRINNKGFYAEIHITVKKINNGRVELEFDELSEWYSTLKFGADYFFEKYQGHRKKGFKITVDKLHTQIADSSTLVVLYVFLMALANALDEFDPKM